MSASYISTGAGGTDFEVEVAAAMLVRVLTRTGDRILPTGQMLERVTLQDRTGPEGFDDIGLTTSSGAGGEEHFYIQAKRSFSLTGGSEFEQLARAIHEYDALHNKAWSAVLIAGHISPSLSDAQTLCESARKTASAEAFEKTWRASRASNAPKRAILERLSSALDGLGSDATWSVLRKLIVLEYDYHLLRSRDRQIAIETIAQHLVSGSNSEAEDIFGSLRQMVLRDGQLAGSYDRAELLSSLSLRWKLLPSRQARPQLDALERHGSDALASIPSYLGGIGQLPAVSLVRADLVREGRDMLASERVVRITGEGGSGKSAILRRLVQGFEGPVFALKDDRVSAASWGELATGLDLSLSATELILELAARGPCLLAIDGADRLLLSARRGVLIDLFEALAKSPLRDHWSVVTTARDFQTRDLVASALTEAGFENIGRRLVVGPIEDSDVVALGEAFPAIATLVRRGDLSDRNRILFLLREVLASPNLVSPYTEVSLAAAWATRGEVEAPPTPQRDAALAQLGELLVCRPSQKPGRSDLDAVGLRHLVEEEAVYSHPTRDTLAFSHDVHEDWVLARTFERHLAELPQLLGVADEPLWWLRALRLVGQMLLEAGQGPDEWLSLLASLEAAPELDPAWTRSLLVAPLYSERAREILDELEPTLLADNAALLRRLLDTLLVFESRLDDQLLRSNALAEMPEAERLRVVASLRLPQWRSWGNFLSWSLPRWQKWPALLMPRLSEIAASWTFATEGTRSPLAAYIVRLCVDWLREIEDARHTDRWENHRNPFGLDTLRYHDWDEIEKRLRRCLKMGVTAAPDVVQSYLERITCRTRLHNAQADMVEEPRQVPARLARSFVDVTIAHFTPRRKRVRYNDLAVQPERFSAMSYHDAGISHDHGFFPASPLRGGFAALFESDEREALRLFHRLEMRASVFYRHYTKWRDRRRALPVRLATPWGVIPMWGDENVFRWSRGILGPNVLGSAYLALDDWLSKAAEEGRPLEELFRLVLRPNGLVATAAPCINAIVGQINTPGQIDAAGPFLGVLRLWNYDIHRHIDDQSHSIPLGFSSRDDPHFEAAKRVSDRYAKRQFLANDLLLPFQLKAHPEAREAFQRQRESWAAADLAAYADELDNSELMAEYEQRIVRCRSDADPTQIEVEEDEQARGLVVRIAPTAEAQRQINETDADRRNLDRAMRLSNWIMKSHELGELAPSLTLSEAVELADELQEIEGSVEAPSWQLFHQLRIGGMIGTAALVAEYATDRELETRYEWTEQRIAAGCQLRRSPEEEATLIDQSVLFNDPQLYGAEGLAALLNRGRGSDEQRQLAIDLATHRLNEVASAIVGKLSWNHDPDFAWRALVAALDVAVIRWNRTWIMGDQARAATERQKARARAVQAALAKNSRLRPPRVPPPPYRNALFWFRTWRKPVQRVRVQSKQALDWSKTTAILKVARLETIAKDPQRSAYFEPYLRELLAWTHAYSEDKVADRYQNHYPYEWAHALAQAMGRFAAAGGDATLWQAICVFDRRDTGEDLVGEYIDAVTTELINSGRAPDDRFWSVWSPPALWALSRVQSDRHARREYSELSRAVAAAGFVGPYMSPIPPDWPHLDAILPAIDNWVQKTASSARAAYSLLGFTERLNEVQRVDWLIPWLARYVEVHNSDEQFWSYGSLGDQAAALVKPLERERSDVRREVRRILAIIADAGSLGAREVLGSFASARN